jgi:methylated-DNA-protein-cysteine methyltransferase-like protein
MKAHPRPAGRGAYDRIGAVVRRIPRGRVASYGQVARVAGLAGRARLVGYALHASAPDSLPWHRVVSAAGSLSLARIDLAGGITQRLRLEREGVTFDARGRVDLARHGWKPRTRQGAARPRSRHGSHR